MTSEYIVVDITRGDVGQARNDIAFLLVKMGYEGFVHKVDGPTYQVDESKLDDEYGVDLYLLKEAGVLKVIGGDDA
jgi:hypothetical protein